MIENVPTTLYKSLSFSVDVALHEVIATEVKMVFAACSALSTAERSQDRQKQMVEDERNQKIKSCEQWRERLNWQRAARGQKASGRKRDNAKQRDCTRLG